MKIPSATYQELLDKISLLNQKIQELERSDLEHRQVEATLRKSEERYRKITEGLSDYFYTVYIRDGQVAETKHSPACAIVTGYTEEDFVADPYLWLHMVVAEDRACVIEHIMKILSGKDIQPFEHRIMRKDGEIRWICDTTILHMDAQGQLESYVGIIKDITEKKRAELELHKSEEKYRLLASTADALAVLDRDCRYIYVNDNYTALFDKDMILTGRNYADWHNEEATALIRDAVNRTLETGNTYEDERWGSRSGRCWHRTFNPSHDKSTVTIVFRDITERKRAEEALEEERRRLQQALDEIRTLRGIIPICSYCKKIRDDEGFWSQVEQYVSDHTDAKFSHGICPACFAIKMKALKA